MRKPTFSQDLWWTSPQVPFDPNLTGYLAPTMAGTKMEEHGWVRVGVAEITYVISDDINPLQEQIEAIEAQIDKVQTEAQTKVNELQQMKANLLALPAPTEPDDDLPF